MMMKKNPNVTPSTGQAHVHAIQSRCRETSLGVCGSVMGRVSTSCALGRDRVGELERRTAPQQPRIDGHADGEECDG
jgi:hypothetical protein